MAPLVVSLPSPTAMEVLEQPTAFRKLAVFEVWAVQAMPLGEVRITPPLPAATNWAPHQATAVSVLVVGEVRRVQLTPSGEVRITPPLPTAAKSERGLDQVTPKRSWVAPEVCGSHEIPSGEVVTMMPAWPAVVNRPPDQAIAERKPAVGLIPRQITPSVEPSTVPLPPTATDCVPDEVTPKRWLTSVSEPADVTLPPGVVTVTVPVEFPAAPM